MDFVFLSYVYKPNMKNINNKLLTSIWFLGTQNSTNKPIKCIPEKVNMLNI